MSDPAPDLDVPPDVADQDDVLTVDQIDAYADEIAPTSLLHSLPADKREPTLSRYAAHGWQIGTTRQAEWAMAQIRAAQVQIDAIDEQADERIARVRDWRDRVAGRLERRRAVLDAKLLAFTEAWHETDPRQNKTLILPSGEVPTRSHKTGTVVVADEAAAVAWVRAARQAGQITAEQADACVKDQDPKVYVSGLRKVVAASRGPGGEWVAVDAGGNIVPGMAAQPPAPTDIGPVKPYSR